MGKKQRKQMQETVHDQKQANLTHSALDVLVLHVLIKLLIAVEVRLNNNLMLTLNRSCSLSQHTQHTQTTWQNWQRGWPCRYGCGQSLRSTIIAQQLEDEPKKNPSPFDASCRLLSPYARAGRAWKMSPDC